MPFIAVAEPPPENAHYVSSYNALLAFCQQRGWLVTTEQKLPHDSVTHFDLSLIRHEILAHYEAFVTWVEPMQGENPFLPVTLHDGKGFLVIPGAYTSTGSAIYSMNADFHLPESAPGAVNTDVSTVPLLWEHFEDLQQLLNSLHTQLCDYHALLTLRTGSFSIRFCFPDSSGIISESHTPGLDSATQKMTDDWKINYQGNPAMTGEGNNFIFYYHFAPDATGIITWQELEAEIPALKRRTVAFDITRTVAGVLAQSENISAHDTDEHDCHLQPVCRYTAQVTLCCPAPIPENDINGVGRLDNACASCNGGMCANQYNVIEPAMKQANGSIPQQLAQSLPGGAGMQIIHTIITYSYAATKYGQYNCDTGLREEYSGSATDSADNAASWHFSSLRRPGGAQVLFSWKNEGDVLVGRPLNDCQYYMLSTTAGIELFFADRFVHVFAADGTLAECRYENTETAASAIPGAEVTRSSLGAACYRFICPAYGTIEVEVDAHGMPVDYNLPEEAAPSRSTTESNTYDTATRITFTNGSNDITGFSFEDFFPPGELPISGEVTECFSGDFKNVQQQSIGKFVERHYDNGEIAKGFWRKEEGSLVPQELYWFSRIDTEDGLNISIEKQLHVKYGANGRNEALSHQRRQRFSFGEKITAEYRGYDTANEQTAIFEYGQNATQGSFGRLQYAEDFNGGWTRHFYDEFGRCVKSVRPVGDAESNAAEALCDVTVYSYLPTIDTEVSRSGDLRIRQKIRQYLGTEVTREYHLYFDHESWHIQAHAAGAVYNAAENKVRKTYAYSSGAFAGRYWKSENPDGSTSLTSYSTGAENTLIVTEESGYLPDHGIRTVTTRNARNQIISRRSYDIASGLLISGSDHTLDRFGRVLTDTTIDGDVTTNEYNCCGLRFMTAPDGSVTEYSYDTFNRLRFTFVAGITTYPVYDAWNNEVESTVTGTQGGELTITSTYDVDGELFQTTDAAGNITTYTRGCGWEEITDSLGGAQRTEYYRDGQIKSLSGSSVVSRNYTYGVENGIIYKQEAHSTTEWSKNYTDFLGRQFKTQYATGLTETTYFDAFGRTIKQESSAGRKTLTLYDEATGKVKYQVLKRTSGDTPNFTQDSVSETQDYYEELAGEVWHVAKNFHFVNGTAVERSCSKSLRSGKKSVSTQAGVTTSSVTTFQGEGMVTSVTTNPDGSTVTSVAEDGLAQSSTHSVLGLTTYVYDQFNRNIGSDHEEGGTPHLYRNTLNALGQVTESTETVGTASRTATFTYDALGRKLTETTPGGVTTTYTYNAQGNVLTVSGDTYPVAYTYNVQGRLLTLTTWQNADTPETTTFTYDDYGRLTGKTYDDGKGETYTYTPDNLPATKTDVKNRIMTYSYNSSGELTEISVESLLLHNFIYDQNGNLLEVQENAASYLYTYDDFGNILTETAPYVTGTLERTYDALRRPATLKYGADYQVEFTYDNAGRLANVNAFGQSATYTRATGANRITSTLFKNGATTIHTATRTYDNLNRLTGINGYSYTLNDKDQCTQLTLPDNQSWNYTYDGLGQVTGGIKKDAANADVSNHAYTYDQIGNRITATENASATNYTANLLNQYTAINEEVPTYDDDGNMLTDSVSKVKRSSMFF